MTDQALPRSMSAGDVLRIPSYRRLWLGQLVSEAGDGLTNLTLLLLVNHLTGSTAAIAAMAICLAIPPMTIGLFAGAYVDRADRRRIMLASDLLRAIVVLGFVFVGSSESLWLLFVLAFVQSSVGTFFAPARGAVIPKVVPPEGLLAANSVAQATRVVAERGRGGHRRPADRRRRDVLARLRPRLVVLLRLVRADPRPAGRGRPDHVGDRRSPGRPRRPSPGSAPASGWASRGSPIPGC